MSDISTPNIELFQRVLDHIHTNPSEWYQQGWGRQFTCGTAYCMAGTAMVLSEDMPGSIHWEDSRFEGIDMPGYYSEDFIKIGSELLGITEDQGNILFASYNSMAQLFALSHVLTDGATSLPETVYIPLRDNGYNLETDKYEDTIQMDMYEMSPENWDEVIEASRLRIKTGYDGESY